ncbi:MAG: hypothetical protein ACXVC2_13020, partial [Bacteroidia bacterium]
VPTLMNSGSQIKKPVSVVLLFILFLALGFKASASVDFFKQKHSLSQQKEDGCSDKNDQSPCEENEKEGDTESEDGDDIFERFSVSFFIFTDPLNFEIDSFTTHYFSSLSTHYNGHSEIPVYLSNRILRI